ncbi:hypothetical protein D3C73_1588010 [compost metagenome]
MHRGFIAVQHAGRCQQFGAGFYAHQHRAEQRLFAQPTLERQVAAVFVHIETGDHQAHIETLIGP